MPTPTQPTPNPARAGNTPTPWTFHREAPMDGKDRGWGCIMSTNPKRLVAGVDTFTTTKWGEHEEHSGMKISDANAAFIVEAVNSHASNIARIERLQGAMRDLLNALGHFEKADEAWTEELASPTSDHVRCEELSETKTTCWEHCEFAKEAARLALTT